MPTHPARMVDEPEQAVEAALAHFNAGRAPLAATLCRAVLAREADHPGAHFVLGVVALSDGDGRRAQRHLAAASAAAPTNALFHFFHANALKAVGETADALAGYARSAGLNPAHAPSHYNMGVCLAALGHAELARASYQRAAALDADDAPTRYNLGNALSSLERYGEAADEYAAALALRPDWPQALVNHGVALQKLGRLDDADALFARARALDPAYAPAPYNHGVLALERGALDQARAALATALTIDPEHVDASWNLALVDMALGDWRRGLAAYKIRWRRRDRGVDRIYEHAPCPAWNGDSLDGRVVLYAAEQGVGDEIMFAACVPALIAAAGHVVVECAPKLAPLFRRSFAAATVAETTARIGDDGLRHHDYSWTAALPAARRPSRVVAGGDAPRHLWRDTPGFGRGAALLRADPDARERWRSRLDALGPAPRIGLCWRSGLRRADRDWHYGALSDWAALLRLEGATLIDLQYDGADAERDRVDAALAARLRRFADLDQFDDLDGVAALIAELDMVVSAPTAVAQLAAALGVATWRVIVGADWSSLGLDPYPWAPAARNWPIARDGDHAAAIAGLAARIKRDLAAP